MKVLDYGAGPVIASTISAATKASEIILADYIEDNCFSLRQWLNCDSQAFDWSPYFSYVVETLEEKNDLDGKVRQQQVRGLVKAVVHCDITQDPPIEECHNQLYDVVMCSLVIEGASSTEDDYCSNIKRLGTLVKLGGKIFYYGVENKVGYYTIGDRNFPNVHIDHHFSLRAFENAGFNVSIKHAPVWDSNHQFFYIDGTKNSP